MERAGLILCERLGRVEVERSRVTVAVEDVERREVEAQRLPGGGAGGHDHGAVRGALPGLGLVDVQRPDSGRLQGVANGRVQVVRKRLGGGALGPSARLVDEPLIGSPRLEQFVPWLDDRTDRHVVP